MTQRWLLELSIVGADRSVATERRTEDGRHRVACWQALSATRSTSEVAASSGYAQGGTLRRILAAWPTH